jgi:hypothetical protein
MGQVQHITIYILVPTLVRVKVSHSNWVPEPVSPPPPTPTHCLAAGYLSPAAGPWWCCAPPQVVPSPRPPSRPSAPHRSRPRGLRPWPHPTGRALAAAAPGRPPGVPPPSQHRQVMGAAPPGACARSLVLSDPLQHCQVSGPAPAPLAGRLYRPTISLHAVGQALSTLPSLVPVVARPCGPPRTSSLHYSLYGGPHRLTRRFCGYRSVGSLY